MTQSVHAPAPAAPRDERRAFWWAAALMTGSLVVLIALFVAFYPRDEEKGISRQQQVDRALTQPPHIIPTPAEGRAPDNPGDPGGWEQLTLFAVMVVGLGLVVLFVWRASRKARRTPAGAGG